jgi:hypothetical protein
MTLTSHQRPHRGATDVWLTPPHIIDAVGPFDLDPCAAVDQPWRTAERQLTEAEDGLTEKWSGFVWCNPPFGPEASRWLERMASHRNGIALVPARTETRWFVDWVWRSADSILFLHGRPHFHHPDGTRGKANSGAPICLIAYGQTASQRIRRCHLAGTLVRTWYTPGPRVEPAAPRPIATPTSCVQ